VGVGGVRKIGVVTVSRSDYSAYLPVLRKIQEDPGLKLQLIVAGMHLSPEFGLTVQAIEADAFEISERVEMLLSSDAPEGISKSMGMGLIGFAQTYARLQPDIVLALGDRFEMHAGVLAALPFKIPVAHIHGGEISEGAFDDGLRHSITKLSHLHFVSTEEYARRVIQMGEESWRVMVSGAPSLDNLHNVALLDRQELEIRFGLSLKGDPLLVTYHPVTLEYEQTEWQMTEFLEALQAFDLPVVFTLPNADTSGRIVKRMIEDYVKTRPNAQIVSNLGTQGYFSLMACAVAMAGNSSSGIIEAASFKLPVVNIGSRQQGRIRGKNVLDVGYYRSGIREAITRAISPNFRAELTDLPNPHGDGHAAESIVRKLKEIKLDEGLLIKRFNDWQPSE
jgi:UDP-N-acetylglucosamine 2-epimerase (non-hydrolysing)/GDP/UDP-N,N'-diacetylbacillosamine 2-epimerase (hydrolysing)